MSFYALYLDITGIQKFVFGSNKLKENLGASYLLENIFDNEKLIKVKPDLLEYSVIGGGNALLAFNDENRAKTYLKEFTSKLLVFAPGVGVSAIVKKLDFDVNDSDSFKEQMNGLFSELRQKKSKGSAINVISKHGFTATCSRSGYSADIYNYNAGDEPGDGAYVSAAVNAKLVSADKAKSNIQKEFDDILLNKYVFANELDKLSANKNEDSHIAIVHIDGNAMGERFSNCANIEDYKNLSISVKNRFISSFRKLAEIFIKNIEVLKDTCGNLNVEDGKTILPLRPIIIGGDDITYVTYGKLGIESAAVFIEELERENLSDSQKVTACAGVAITKEKYPFFRGYQLAEELCHKAKEKRLKIKQDEERNTEKESNCSWIDFHIAFSGLTGSINEIRDEQYNLGNKSLLYRPYALDEKNRYSYYKFIDNCAKLSKWPRSKQKELRQMLTASISDLEAFKAQLKVRGLHFPASDKDVNENLYNEINETPYYDMVECSEFLIKLER